MDRDQSNGSGKIDKTQGAEATAQRGASNYLEGEDTTLGLGLVTDVGVLLSHTDHDTLVAGATNNGWEDGAWGIISGESGLAHSGAVVNDKSSNFLRHD